jgi:hypothetical protein
VLAEMVVSVPISAASQDRVVEDDILVGNDYIVRVQEVSDVFDKQWCGLFHMDVVALCMPESKDMSQRD